MLSVQFVISKKKESKGSNIRQETKPDRPLAEHQHLFLHQTEPPLHQEHSLCQGAKLLVHGLQGGHHLLQAITSWSPVLLLLLRALLLLLIGLVKPQSLGFQRWRCTAVKVKVVKLMPGEA